MLSKTFKAELLAPFPGRLSRAFEVSLVCAFVVIVSMTYQIPSPDVSAYVVFFAAKENSGLNMLMSLVFVIVVAVVVAISFTLSILFINLPEMRILALAAVAFTFFFLAAASKLAPLAGTMGLIIAYVLDLLGSTPVGEITTRGLLYAWLFVAMPMGVFFAYNIFFGRHPEKLLRIALAERIRSVADLLRIQDAGSKNRLMESISGGNAEAMKALRMVKLLQRQPPDTTQRLAALITLSHALALAAVAVEGDSKRAFEPDSEIKLGGEISAGTQSETGLAARLYRLATMIECLPRVIHPAALEQNGPATAHSLTGQIISIVELMENVVSGQKLGEIASPPKAGGHKAGFFAPDAFTNPAHVRFAGKATAAVMVCYLTFTLLDWPGIHTCMITCFIVSLTTVGETTQKLFLRITGCVVGAAVGLLTIVYILPSTTSIADFALLIFAITLPAAWIAVGRPTVAYIGFQMAFALYLCILQGTEPKFDLTLARDRTIGILFGNIVVYLIFTRVFPVSILARLRGDLVALIERCQAVLKSIADLRSPISISSQIAEIQASLEGVESAFVSFAYEVRRSPNRRLQSWAGELSLRALHKLIDELARLAAYPPPDPQEGEAADILRRIGHDIDAQLDALKRDISTSNSPGFARVCGSEFAVLSARLRAAEPSWSTRSDALEALQNRLKAFWVTASRYRRLLTAGSETDG
jgi:multidrug resistance protein MdtO